MTNFPSFFITAGLNVPADSNPLPLGDTTGSATSRVHFPKGGAKVMAATATKAMWINTDTLAVCDVRFAEKRILIITRLPSLPTSGRQKQFSRGTIEAITNNLLNDQYSAISRMKDCSGTRSVASLAWPFTLKRTVPGFAAGISIFADRTMGVGLYKMKFNFCDGNCFV